MKRMTLAVAALAALLASPAIAVADADAAKPKLPKPRSTIIKPNVGVGGVKLGKRMRPWPRGWRHPFSCHQIQGTKGCIWTTRKDALPKRGQSGIRGPFVIVGGRRNVDGIIIGAGAKGRNTRALRRWKTRKGIGFKSTVDEFLKAYPNAASTPVPGNYHIAGQGRVTAFVFRNGRLNSIEITSS